MPSLFFHIFPVLADPLRDYFASMHSIILFFASNIVSQNLDCFPCFKTLKDKTYFKICKFGPSATPPSFVCQWDLQGGICPFVQLRHEHVKQHWAQHWTLGDITNDKPATSPRATNYYDPNNVF